MDALWENSLDPQLTDAEHEDLQGALSLLLRKAQTGTLQIADKRGDAGVIRDTILELRPTKAGARPAFGREPRHLRLYFGEPEDEATSLLGLHLDTKGDGRLGLDEQDQSILRAFGRADEWAKSFRYNTQIPTERVGA